MPTFPSDFLWGAATAGHQIEGSNVLSDIWAMEHIPNAPFAEPSGDACDSYHRYEEDIALLAGSGLNSYRFSIEWSRVEPEKGFFSVAELHHYRKMVAACTKNGVTPVVTLNHFTVPAWFARDGAWNQADAPELFEKYCRKVVEHIGVEVTWWATFNEPNAGALLLATGSLPLGALDDSSELGRGQSALAQAFAARVGGEAGTASMALPILTPAGIENVFESHIRGRAAIKELLPNARVGWTIATHDIQSVDGGEEKAAEVYAQAIEPFWQLSKEDDFVGIQTYTREVYGPEGKIEAERTDRTFQTGWEYYPQALGNTVRRAAGFTGVPVLVTENGMATDNDELRIGYTRDALIGLRDAMRDGVQVLGYLHWTLLDNWEWHTGFAITFGLNPLDRETFERTPKPSLGWLGQVAATNGSIL